MDDLLRYYEEELLAFRRDAAEFARRYPKLAARIELGANQATDPHVERLIESCALLCARTRSHMDGQWPAIAQSILQILFPDYLCPIPSMSIARIELDPELSIPEGVRISRGTELYSRPVAGESCRFRTCFDVESWPLSVNATRFLQDGPNRPALELTLRAEGAIRLERLQALTLYLQGASAFRLYEMLSSRVDGVEAWRGGKRIAPANGASRVRGIGFSDDESALPAGRHSFAGFRLLREYLCFPEKFLFTRIDLPPLSGQLLPGDTVSLRLLLSSAGALAERDLDADAFQLNCTPVTNLFRQIAEPVLVTQNKTEYLVIPDVRRRRTELYSIDEVLGTSAQATEPRRFLPLYVRDNSADSNAAYWTVRLQPPSRSEEPIDAYLSIVDLALEPSAPAVETLTVRATCTNMDLPSRLPWGDDSGDLQSEASSPMRRIVLLSKPTPRLPPPLGGRAEWALISQLALQHLSLAEDGASALRRLLHALDFTNDRAVQVQIEGILELVTARELAHFPTAFGMMPAPGTRIDIRLNEEAFADGGAYLFGAVLDRFLSLYAAVNTFTSLRVNSNLRKEVVGTWPPRAGIKPVI